MQELDEALIERMTEAGLADVAGGGAVEPLPVMFLLRRYAATGRDDLRDALERALEHAVTDVPRREDTAQPLWLTAFVEACTLSETTDLLDTASALARALRRQWPAAQEVAAAMRSIAACLAAASVLDPREIVPPAIDELERVVGAAYRPGEGMAHLITAPRFVRGGLEDQVTTAQALLTAYTLTARVPYAMLAEELVQGARRTWWDETAGSFVECGARPVRLNCEAARVLVRLAVLHRDDEYRAAAVIALDADYFREAERTLASQAEALGASGEERARFGLALDEILRLR